MGKIEWVLRILPIMHASPVSSRPVVITIVTDIEGRARCFTAAHKTETVTFEPGRTWTQVDHHKWVMRGLIEEPQSFSVRPDGTVLMNGETYAPNDPAAAEALSEQLNRRHGPGANHPDTPAASATPSAPPSNRVEFRVHIDALGHLLVNARRRSERAETGVRGLLHLAKDGWLISPRQFHVDPLQRYVEMDGRRFDCDAHGARELEQCLNQEYAPSIASPNGVAIEIRENAAAATGFDIHFSTVRAGTRFEIKGHLDQAKLDILQDHDRCDILRPDILLRLSPPFLYIRRRRPDGGEERLPQMSDFKYRGMTSTELQRIFNHPLLRIGLPTTPEPEPAAPVPLVPAPAAMSTPRRQVPEVIPNVGLPAPPPAPIPADSVEKPLQRPAPPRAGADPSSAADPPLPAAAPALAPSSDVDRLFADIGADRVHRGIFQAVRDRKELTVQDARLSLPRVFENRRFEILNFAGAEISSVLELRGAEFHGFYLSHIGPSRTDLVYASRGTHIEWTPQLSSVQAGRETDPAEFRGAGLRGLAEDRDGRLVFLVTTEYRKWVRTHERACLEAGARFLSPEEWVVESGKPILLWPVATAE